MSRARIFIDFWNFQLAWNQRAGTDGCDWRVLPARLVQEAGRTLGMMGLPDVLTPEETLVYASVRAGTSDASLRKWLASFLDLQPGFRVKTRERRVRAHGVHCRQCGSDTTACPACGSALDHAPEKGVDAAIVTDLLSLAVEGAYDVAVLVTSDADMIPAVEWVQARGLKVVNAAWAGHGYDLMRTCWASFQLDPLVPSLVRPARSNATRLGRSSPAQEG